MCASRTVFEAAAVSTLPSAAKITSSSATFPT
jgi:hypothetical protein